MKLKYLFMATVALLSAACSHQPASEEKAPITKPQITIEGGRLTPEALWAMGRIGGAVYDVETGQIAYTVSYYSVEENRSTTWIRICDPTQEMKVLDEFVGSNPAWYGNSGVLAYLKGGKLYLRTSPAPSSRGEKDIEITAAGENLEGFLYSPDRQQLIAIRTISRGEKQPYADLDKTTGRVIDDLLYKHWDEWVDEVPHPFLIDLNTPDKEPVDLLEGTMYECPMRPFGGVEQIAWNPNNEEIAYTCRKKNGLEYAVSTNSDIYLYNIRTRETRNITEGNLGYDINPAYSPDGSRIAWLSMECDGYESDENRLFVINLKTGEKTFVSHGLDTNVDSYYWEDNEHIVFSAVWHATAQLYKASLPHPLSPKGERGEFEQLTGGQFDHEPIATIEVMDENNQPQKALLCLRHSMREANELFAIREGVPTQLTHENDNIYSQIERSTVVPRWQTTSDGKQMLTWIILPPNFDPNKKYPTLLYCEGGPQSPVSQFWSFRWNFMMMSAGDYVIVAPNRRGLPGFGKEWNEEISGDYGGQCMIDYLTAIDEACENLPYVDKDRLGAVGASFGGYSVYWLAGHHEKRFKCFIAHDGIFNMEMQYLETEEKWFANWDMGGAYWEHDNAIAQRTFANSPHKFVDQWDTPILCIHGEKDYRILANQAMAAFDAAKMRGVPAQLLIFPDENHWVLKPQNGILWQRTFRAWLDKWLQ